MMGILTVLTGMQLDDFVMKYARYSGVPFRSDESGCGTGKTNIGSVDVYMGNRYVNKKKCLY